MSRLLALAIGGTPIPKPSGLPDFQVGDVGQTLIQKIIIMLIILAVILCLFFLVTAGIKWITSGGDKEGIAHARLQIIYALVGLVVVFLSFLIIKVIGGVFGVNFI